MIIALDARHRACSLSGSSSILKGPMTMKPVNDISAHMTVYPHLASREMTVPQALARMDRNDIRHLPVVEDGNVVGVVSDRDLRKAALLPAAAGLTLSEVMTPRPYCTPTGTPLAEVAEIMAREKYGCVIVLGDFGRVVGVFTTTDGMRVLSRLLSDEVPSGYRMAGIGTFLSLTPMVGR
jgi:CBS domain-containing protein